MNRDANIDVVNDSNGLVALTPGPNVESDVVREKDGELTIDFTADGSAGGVNINSRYQVGTFDSDYSDIVPGGALETQAGIGDDYAFSIINQDSADHGIHVAYEADDTDDYNGSSLNFQYVPTGSAPEKLRVIDESVGNDVEAFSTTIESGEGYKAALLVDTRGAEGADPADIDLSGELRISAYEPES